ncbi:hypothetical protein LXA43DRAFT_80654 [Ganoderma leucocontextum]|nr:hypothetical protein LXA43DRAFT_80654 [Ganoderma leucocontextum]
MSRLPSLGTNWIPLISLLTCCRSSRVLPVICPGSCFPGRSIVAASRFNDIPWNRNNHERRFYDAASRIFGAIRSPTTIWGSD